MDYAEINVDHKFHRHLIGKNGANSKWGAFLILPVLRLCGYLIILRLCSSTKVLPPLHCLCPSGVKLAQEDK